MTPANFPQWLHQLAVISLGVSLLCCVVIAADECRRPQRMWIMNLVWPLTALFGGLLWLVAYYAWGLPDPEAQRRRGASFAIGVAVGTSHCGAGCTLGDLIAEWTAFAVPSFAVWFGWGTLFADKIWAVWIADFALAFAFGVAFQYFTLQPMRHLSLGRGLLAALKADTASISAWQVGMYGVMALIQFAWFTPQYGGPAPVNTPEFWFAMQLAMLAGFTTSYPVNWWLVRWKVKDSM